MVYSGQPSCRSAGNQFLILHLEFWPATPRHVLHTHKGSHKNLNLSHDLYNYQESGFQYSFFKIKCIQINQTCELLLRGLLILWSSLKVLNKPLFNEKDTLTDRFEIAVFPVLWDNSLPVCKDKSFVSNWLIF